MPHLAKFHIKWPTRAKLVLTIIIPSGVSGDVGMWDLSREDYLQGIEQHDQYYHVVVILVSIVLSLVVAKAWRVICRPGRDDQIPGHVGLPYLGESLPFLSATNSDKGCYDFVRLRQLWLVILSISIDPSGCSLVTN